MSLNRFIGIGKLKNEPWYLISLFLFNRMVTLALYTPKNKKPTYFYYNREEFTFCYKQKSLQITWFFGVAFLGKK